MNNLSLLPQPRSLKFTTGQHALQPLKYILLDAPEASQLVFSGRLLKDALKDYGEVVYMLSASVGGPSEDFGVVLRQVEDPAIPDQGYRLSIQPDQITVEASSPAGIFYGVATLSQVLKQSGQNLPCLEISDWPDFPARGYMLDISRDKVPTMETLLQLIDKLAAWKYNQLQLYTEHTFAYLNHPVVWSEATPMTGQDILELDRYCKERFIELVPNQNSFGHMNRWLTHMEYAPLAEVTEGFTTPWGFVHGPFTIDPTNPASFDLIRSLFDELLPHFTSRQVNIGCDETFDLGQGRSREEVERIGKYRVYLDFLLKVSKELIGRGYTVQFWGDIVQEEPDVIPLLPQQQLLALDWGYEETHPFDLECSRFKASGIPFYVCPGTSTWCTLGGRTKNAIGNLLNAAEAGLKYGAVGFLNTDWGDRGHWQTLPISYLGIAVGAAYSWALEANRSLDVVEVLNRYAFEDAAGIMGKVAYDLGEVYRLPGLARPNGSQLFWILQYSDEQLTQAQRKSENYTSPDAGGRLVYVEDAVLREAISTIDRILAPLEESRMAGEDAELVKREFTLTAWMMKLACLRALLADNPAKFRAEYTVEIAAMLDEYKQIWLTRNRSGGLKDSLVLLEKLQG
ncbi:MAG: family 20 glycosylhydrolase [Chloroflexi bacterium]|nr:family 20 glycosylhydrolase [Chloroflexota bacterium]OJV91333.1 MAG: glycoside hydrolase [Chloroflexi bacterium 54-19]